MLNTHTITGQRVSHCLLLCSKKFIVIIIDKVDDTRVLCLMILETKGVLKNVSKTSKHTNVAHICHALLHIYHIQIEMLTLQDKLCICFLSDSLVNHVTLAQLVMVGPRNLMVGHRPQYAQIQLHHWCVIPILMQQLLLLLYMCV